MTYAQVVRVLGDSRTPVLAGFRAGGGDKERWGRADQAVMADALTREEDKLELGPKGSRIDALRGALRTVRRTLEVEAVT
jgi:hypothetical protein